MYFSTSAAIALTNNNVTLSPSQYSKPIIVLTGTLTGNVVVTFPAIVRQWDVINSTIGSYTVSAQTSGGIPIILSQGGSVELRGDGTNVLIDALQVSTATASNQAVTYNQLLTSKNYYLVGGNNSSSFTTPSTTQSDTAFKITLIGGCGGGGGSNGTNSIAGGGGAGGCYTFLITGLSPSTTYNYTIGAGGAGGSTSGGNGGNGGTSSLVIGSNTYTVGGGQGGAGSTTATINSIGAQGTASANVLAAPGFEVYQTSLIAVLSNTSGVNAACPGGSILYGSGGLPGTTGSGSGGNATGFGAGGGGGFAVTAPGGSGIRGACIIEYIV
jgi:hypothetical protein